MRKASVPSPSKPRQAIYATIPVAFAQQVVQRASFLEPCRERPFFCSRIITVGAGQSNRADRTVFNVYVDAHPVFTRACVMLSSDVTNQSLPCSFVEKETFSKNVIKMSSNERVCNVAGPFVECLVNEGCAHHLRYSGRGEHPTHGALATGASVLSSPNMSGSRFSGILARPSGRRSGRLPDHTRSGCVEPHSAGRVGQREQPHPW